MLQVYAASKTGAFHFVRAFPILAASGGAGPKLREGDGQVPEGLYKIELLNPNSSYHLSLRVSYPNAWDREHGRADGRTKLGGDIMIHGKAASVGCLAMGDPAAEDLFVLAAKTGIKNIEVILSPLDFRVRKFSAPEGSPAWTAELYEQIKAALKKFPVTGN
jgi:murein L,D-transpeptidase YafK